MFPPFFERKLLGALTALEGQSIQVVLLKPIQPLAGKGFGFAAWTQRFFVFVQARNADESMAIDAFFQLVSQFQTQYTLEVSEIYSMAVNEVFFVDEVFEFSTLKPFLALKLGEECFFIYHRHLFFS